MTGEKTGGSSMRKVWLTFGGLIAGIPLAWLMDVAKVGGQLEQAVVAVPPALALLFDELLENRKRSEAERRRRLVEGAFYREAWVVVLYLVLALQLTTRVLGALVGAAIGLALGVAGVVDPDAIAASVASSSPLLVLLLACVVTIFFAKYAAHHLRHHAFRWIALALLANTAIDLGVGLAYASYLEAEVSVSNALIGSVFALGLLVGAAAIGSKWAERTHDLFVLNRLSRRLTPSERGDLVSLVADLPVVKPAPGSDRP